MRTCPEEQERKAGQQAPSFLSTPRDLLQFLLRAVQLSPWQSSAPGLQRSFAALSSPFKGRALPTVNSGVFLLHQDACLGGKRDTCVG